jgi:hypothetical protein
VAAQTGDQSRGLRRPDRRQLLMKGDFTGVVLASGDSISITAKLQFP